MRRRTGFTLVEVLVAMALTLFIMSILSAAFVAATSAVSDLKAAGDLAERLRRVPTCCAATWRPTIAIPTPTLARWSGLRPVGDGPAADIRFFRIYQAARPGHAGRPAVFAGPVHQLRRGRGFRRRSRSYIATDHALRYTIGLHGTICAATSCRHGFPVRRWSGPA